MRTSKLSTTLRGRVQERTFWDVSLSDGRYTSSPRTLAALARYSFMRSIRFGCIT